MQHGVTTVSAHLGPDDQHLLDLLRSRAREGDRSLSREVTRTLRAALTNDNGGPAKAAAVKTGAGTPDGVQV
jgi:plasmid stability protein